MCSLFEALENLEAKELKFSLLLNLLINHKTKHDYTPTLTASVSETTNYKKINRSIK